MSLKERTYTCIVCPNSCEITVKIRDGSVSEVSGASCPRGEDYARQEILAPVRNIATTVLVRGGSIPLCSVRLSQPIPRERIFDAISAIHEVSLDAPVRAGTVLIQDLLGLGVDVLLTRDVPALEGPFQKNE